MRQKTGRCFFLVMGTLLGSALGCNLSGVSACAQAKPGGEAAKTPPTSSEAEKTLAQEITAKPLEEALKAISAADSSLITEGLYNAIRDVGQKASNEDPHRSVEIFKEDEAVAVRAGLPIPAADAHLNEALGMFADGEIGDAITAYGQTLDMYRAAKRAAEEDRRGLSKSSHRAAATRRFSGCDRRRQSCPADFQRGQGRSWRGARGKWARQCLDETGKLSGSRGKFFGRIADCARSWRETGRSVRSE